MRTCRILPAVLLVCLLVAASTLVRLSAAAEEPLKEAGLQALLELKIDDEVIIARIKKSGLAFAGEEAALQRLAEAGASPAVLGAIREAGAKKSAGGGAAAITYSDVLKLLQLEIPEEQILKRLAKSPTVFTLSKEKIAELKAAGASEKLLTALQTAREISPQAAELITNFALVLDCSGSMKEKTKEGETKMEAAKRVVADLIQKIPEGLNVTFVIYGHEVFGGAEDPRNCQAVKVARPLSPLDAAGKSDLSRLVAGLKPTGATPIALSLKVAGEELAKDKDAFCGIVLITDGLESCKGDPAAEAAALLANLKLSFGVNVVGFGVKPEEDAALKAIADAGKGKYYGADDAAALADALGKLSDDLDKAAKPPKKDVSNRRAIKVLKPDVEFPPYVEIRVLSRGLGSTSVVAKGKYGDEIRIPSATEKYEILWVPKTGEPVAMLKDFTLAERKVIEIKPEEHLGMIKVNGKGTPKKGISVYQRGLGSTRRLAECKKFGEIMVVPAEKVNVSVDDEDIEEGLQVEAGTLHELE
ncbi:MAG: vWA domain-containing protein [Pirellulaceae bacterium]